MSTPKRRLKRGAKKRLFRRFMTIMLATFTVGTVIVVAGLGTYQYFSKDNNFFGGFTKLNAESKETKKEEEKLKTNVAVFGVDKDGYRTDTIFVVHFDGVKNTADVVGVPRDTKVRLSDSDYQKITSINKYTPRSVKINELTAYAGIQNLKEYTVREIERMMGIRIDNYITVEIEAFRKIVDIIGGVEVDVPMRMKYRDPFQDLYIDLQPGLQHLDGNKAEQLVRFRKGDNGGGYADGDVGRIQTQQAFLKAFAQQLLSSENISNLPKMIPTIFQHVKTDINILDIPKYYKYASSFNSDAINFHTIPGEAAYQGSLWYFIADMNKMDEFAQKIFYPTEEETNPTDMMVEDKTVKIEVLNGGAAAGTAGNLKDNLEKDGYNVVKIGNYTGTNQSQTRIYVKDKSKATQFEKYFSNSTILVNQSLEKNIDVQIVIGSEGI